MLCTDQVATCTQNRSLSYYIVEHLLFVLSGTVAFVGSHLDVVPANPETWERNPFKLVVEVGTPLLLQMACLFGVSSVSRTEATSLVEEELCLS